MTRLYCHSFETTFGTIRTASSDAGLAFVGLPSQTSRQFEAMIHKSFPACEIASGGEINREAEVQIASYLRGKLRRFTLDLEWYGTAFQQKVLRAVASIPYGEVKSYGEIAREIAHPGASRAVGTVNARNRLPLVIPCHRVVASGGLGGYGVGLAMKRHLLIMERCAQGLIFELTGRSFRNAF